MSHSAGKTKQQSFRTQLHRILESQTFRNKETLRSLLVYLAEKSLAGESESLKEYTVGVEHFGKPQDYNPQVDASVRVQASKLRQKLQEYYRTEGAADPLVIEFPKGHFQLGSRRHRDEDYLRNHVAPVSVLRRWRRISLAFGVALLASLLLAAYWGIALWQQAEGAAGAEQIWTPELESIWKPYLESPRPVLICLGTPLFTKFSPEAFIRMPRINEWEQTRQSPRWQAFREMLESPYAQPSYNFTGIGEATGAVLLAKLLFPRRRELLLNRSSLVSWEDIRNKDVIFLGSPKFIPQLKSIPIECDFVIEGGSIQNLRPRAGEHQIYGEVWAPDKSAILEDFALITRIPGLHGQGELMMLGASSTEGTWAAVEYVTQAHYARELVERLRQPHGDIPESYQVVVSAKFETQVPVQISYVTHRVLNESRQTADLR